MSIQNQLSQMDTEALDLLQKHISKVLIKDSKYSTSDVLKNLSIIDVTLAMNTVFDFNDVNLIIANKDQSIAFHLLESYFNQKLSNVYISTQPGDALGVALSISLQSDKLTIIMVDDFIMNYGKTFESLVQIAKHHPNIVIIYLEETSNLLKKHNSVDSLIKSVRISKTYSTIKKDLKSILSNPVGKPILSTLTRVKEGVKELVLEPTIFNQFGFEYQGLINGENYKECLRVFNNAYNIDGPVLIHIKTNVTPLEKLELPKFKIEDELPESYMSYLDAVDQTLCNFEDIIVCTDITKNNEHMASFAITHPDQYYVSTGTYQSMVDFVKGLVMLHQRVVFVVDASSYKYIAALIDEQFYATSNLLIIIRNSGLTKENNRSHQGVFDIGFNALMSDQIYMGKNLAETQAILHNTLEKDTFPLTFIRIPDRVEKYNADTNYDSSGWELVNPDIKPKSVILTYGPAVEQVYRKVRVNDLKVWVVNCRRIVDLDYELLDKIKVLNIPVGIYDLEDVNHTLYKVVQSYSNELKIHNLAIHRNHLEYDAKTLKDRYALNVDQVLNVLPK